MRIVRDLLASGYDGGFSMEPHMKVVFHDDSRRDGDAEARLALYVEYGRRFEALLAGSHRRLPLRDRLDRAPRLSFHFGGGRGSGRRSRCLPAARSRGGRRAVRPE